MSDMSVNHESVLTRAIAWAAQAHEGQRRKGTDIPYIVHPMEAVAIAATMTDDPEVLAAAALHDVVEDCGVTAQEIRAKLGSRVADLVEAETQRDTPAGWQRKKLSAVRRLAASDRDAQIVALSDKLSNLRAIERDLDAMGDALWDRFGQKNPSMHRWYHASLAEAMSGLSGLPAYEEYRARIRRVFGPGRGAKGLRFVKMQGIGNDFIVVNAMDGRAHPDLGGLSARMCDRHFGIGADGLLWICPSERGAARMRVFNSDGSEAEMCGNGLRCAAQFLRDEGVTDADSFVIETAAGDLTASFGPDGITCDMGAPEFRPERIPVNAPENRIRLATEAGELAFTCVSMGNPHAVTFDLFPDDGLFYRMSPALERDGAFPNRANIEFARVRDGGIDVRVWERGDGETLGCGTGACAVLAAAVQLGLTGREADVRLPGGTLRIRWDADGRLKMTGPAATVCEGVWREPQQG